MRTLSLPDKNTFYAPAGDECWIILAQEIMSSYVLMYSHLFPTTARSQFEYDELDKKKFAAQRRSVLRRIKYGPLRNAVNVEAAYAALERERQANKRNWGVTWIDHNKEDLKSL